MFLPHVTNNGHHMTNDEIKIEAPSPISTPRQKKKKKKRKERKKIFSEKKKKKKSLKSNNNKSKKQQQPSVTKLHTQGS